MRKGTAYAALYIPPNLTRELMAGHSAQVELLVDGSNSTTALQALQTGLGVALPQSMDMSMRDTGRTGRQAHARHRPDRHPDLCQSTDALHPDHKIPSLLCASRSRRRFANGNDSCGRH